MKFGLVGSGIGAISTAGFAWKYSKSPHGIFSFHATALAISAYIHDCQSTTSIYVDIGCCDLKMLVLFLKASSIAT